MKFKQWDCYIRTGYYVNGNTALQLFSRNDHEPIAVATINLYEKLPQNQAYIKDYSENEGMLELLIEAGIVTRVIGFKNSGYITAPLCELDIEIIKKYAI